MLNDVVNALYNLKYVDELFKPRRVYSNTQTFQIFERIAHSSIMRLNPSSMASRSVCCSSFPEGCYVCSMLDVTCVATDPPARLNDRKSSTIS